MNQPKILLSLEDWAKANNCESYTMETAKGRISHSYGTYTYACANPDYFEYLNKNLNLFGETHVFFDLTFLSQYDGYMPNLYFWEYLNEDENEDENAWVKIIKHEPKVLARTPAKTLLQQAMMYIVMNSSNHGLSSPYDRTEDMDVSINFDQFMDDSVEKFLENMKNFMIPEIDEDKAYELEYRIEDELFETMQVFTFLKNVVPDDGDLQDKFMPQLKEIARLFNHDV